MSAIRLTLLVTLIGCHSSVGLCGDQPVCGSDGLTYEDRCAALSAGADVLQEGTCDPGCDAIGECVCAASIGADGCPVCDCPADASTDVSVPDADPPDAPFDAAGDVARPDMRTPDTSVDSGPDADGGVGDGSMDEGSADAVTDAGCRMGLVDCSGSCVDPEELDCDLTSPAVTCAINATGDPTCLCDDPDLTVCDGACVDLEYGRSSCGRCGVLCRGVCNAGDCLAREDTCDDVDFTDGGSPACSQSCGDVYNSIVRGVGGALLCEVEAPGDRRFSRRCAAGSTPMSETQCISLIADCCFP